MSARDCLSADGAIASAIKGFQPREQQLQLADAVEHTIANQSVLVGEAGTGVGKTFAYLVPALLSGKKTIVSTGTRHLQDQLFHNDLPLVVKALGLAPKRALLKGRANYLCLDRLERAEQNPALSDPVVQAQLAKIRAWAGRSKTGDISECTTVPSDAVAWANCVSEEYHCSQHEGDSLEGCFVTAARRKAQGADIVVVNHHLLCADLALKETGFGELLPSASTIIVDEAHQLADVASVFFGERLGSRLLLDLSRDVVAAQIAEAPDQIALRSAAQQLETRIRQFRLALGHEGIREAWGRAIVKPVVADALTVLLDEVRQLADELESAADRGKALEAQWQRALRIVAQLEPFDRDTADKRILWYETYRVGFALNITPIDVAMPFSRARATMDSAWVMVSATMAINQDFSHFTEQLGIEECDSLLLDSPFDYKRNALMYAPPNLPEPNTDAYTQAVVDTAVPCIEAAGGRSFMLFTSHRALRAAETLLSERIDYPLFVQGDGAKHDLLEAFKRSGNGVLLGTSSFWEGVDVRGSALSCVIIDKLPFASPGDPVMEARINSIKSGGGNAFFSYQLPQAIVALKQGVGRLIRDQQDRGVLVICDPRLTSRSYGRQVVDSLPPMLRTRSQAVVERFFALAPS